mmetsp:Transcript_26143/g.48201  ORF Transcript_26143/g.48201 Transcript_26143/m.48201 type:complete len:778 (-) Transcript_26143:77-2410(-)
MSQAGGGGGDPSEMVNAMGAINALRTGNVVLDMVIAMTIPVIFRSLFNFVAQVSDRFQRGDWRMDMLLFWRKMIERTIDHKTTSNIWGDSITDRDTRNNVLLKAIQLYLSHKKIKWARSRVSLTAMTQNTRPWWWGDDDGDERTPAGKLKKYQLSESAPNYVWQPLGIYGDKPIQAAASSSSSKEAAPLLAIEDAKPEVVELRVEEDEQDKGEKGEKTISTVRYRFRSYSAHAIDSFINEAYQWYLAELKQMDDNSRYLYEMQMKVGTSGESTGARTYKRYKLSDDKSFESLFFEEKEGLLTLLKHFTSKTGKYAVKGYPHKLGLLLHGPPGTGKTSLIKVMAQHLQRSIVNVPLARISTNQELMDIMFDQQYVVEGEEVPIKLGFKDVIFSMEDVDAASKVVQRRDGKATASVTQTEVIEAPRQKTGWEILLESNDEECRALVKLLMEKSEKLKKAALESKTVCNMAKQLVAPAGLGMLLSASSTESDDKKQREEAKETVEQLCSQREIAGNYIKQFASSIKALIEAGTVPDDTLADELLGAGSVGQLEPFVKTSSTGYGTGPSSAGDDDEEDDTTGGGLDMNLFMGTLASVMGSGSGKGSGPGGDMMGPMGSAFGSSYDSKKDKLNLSGLLNVLDGVVDTPARVLIMTTNHPEQLDPALIRPGRIDKKLLLGYMSSVHATSMVEYYFQAELSAKQRNRLQASIVGSDEKGIPAINLTPAQIEQLCAEYDEVENLIINLENKAHPKAAPRTPKHTAGPGGRPTLNRATSKTLSFDH